MAKFLLLLEMSIGSVLASFLLMVIIVISGYFIINIMVPPMILQHVLQKKTGEIRLSALGLQSRESFIQVVFRILINVLLIKIMMDGMPIITVHPQLADGLILLLISNGVIITMMVF